MPENLNCTAKGDRILKQEKEKKRKEKCEEKNKKFGTRFSISLDFTKYSER